ncbi:endonuclease/exonuclease/phosphatase family protein [Aquincola tertiaricarbonis]|uniref:endonuclease/exonuclease/phosphatase family protein n=1 Tax=Aquincola tertiaricarbonis TaxID=391953 RepID=UPI000614C842|nr:endonuclease/exonuclease/phosphatase family protein [Aquincola tertiaricarbonis]
MSFIQVASWNVEHLSGHPRAQRRQSAFALADHIEMAGIDVIALQEIYVTDSAEKVSLSSKPGAPDVSVAAWEKERRNSDLDVVCAVLKEHLDTDWRYLILPNRTAGDKSQLCAVLWNTGRLTFRAATPLQVSHKEGTKVLWDRKPHLVSFQSDVLTWRRDDAGKWHQLGEKRTLSVVPLHMKSNFGGATASRAVRAAEAKTLCEALKAAEAAAGAAWDPSVLLLGDTNILNNSEPAIETFIANGWRDLNNNDQSTYWSPQFPNGSPFDRVFVAENRREFRYSRQYILRSSDLEAHDRFLSDHYMVKVSVKDYVDDADPRGMAPE